MRKVSERERDQNMVLYLLRYHHRGRDRGILKKKVFLIPIYSLEMINKRKRERDTYVIYAWIQKQKAQSCCLIKEAL